jgi:hypothetical protein
MRTYSTNSGPFSERPFYKQKEIERICEDELRGTGHFPTDPEPVRIEMFISKRFSITPIYEVLPTGVLGYTTFGMTGVVSMHISSALIDGGTRTAECRATATLAHEAGHGLLHNHLFALADQGLSLFKGDPDVSATKILCRDSGVAGGEKTYDGRWWEHQANMVISPLLMPRSLVTRALQPYFSKQGLLGIEEIDPGVRAEAIDCLANTFDVNRIVAKIRLDEMYSERTAQMLL